MEIVYCDDCGIRVPTNEVTRGLTDDGKVRCDKCRPSAVPLPALTGVSKRPSGDGITVAPHPAHGHAHGYVPGPVPLPNATPPRTHKKTQINTEKPPPRTSEASRQNNMIIGLGIAGGFVMLVGLVFMFSGDKTEKKAAQSSSTTSSAASGTATRTETTVESTNTRRVEDTRTASARQTGDALPQPQTPPPPPPPPPLAAPAGMGGSNSKTDPEAIAQGAYDKVLLAIAKEDAAGKIKQLDQFVKDANPDTLAAARARAMLSGLKKAEEAANAPPPPPPAPPAAVTPEAPPAAVAAGSSAFKEDFETTAYGINFGTVTGSLPGNRPGKALKLGAGSGNDTRGGIYPYAYPNTSPIYKTTTLAVATEGMKVRFSYFNTHLSTDTVVGFIPPGTDDAKYCKVTNRDPKKGAWTSVELTLSDFKDDNQQPVKIPVGSRISRLEFWGYGVGECYIDDVELIAGQ